MLEKDKHEFESSLNYKHYIFSENNMLMFAFNSRFDSTFDNELKGTIFNLQHEHITKEDITFKLSEPTITSYWLFDSQLKNSGALCYMLMTFAESTKTLSF
jgi:hypothetical protein